MSRAPRLTTYKKLYSELNTLAFRHLSTKIHKHVTILKFLQKSQDCLLEKQIISRYRPDLIENLTISNVNIFGIFGKISQKLCNLVLITGFTIKIGISTVLKSQNYDEN